MGAALQMGDCRIAKAESWLTEWADTQIRGVEAVNGYANQSNLKLVSDQGFKVGGQQSKPLIYGRMGLTVSATVDLALKSGMSGRQVKACIPMFRGYYEGYDEPVNGWKKVVPHDVRIIESTYSPAQYWRIRHDAIGIVMRIKI